MYRGGTPKLEFEIPIEIETIEKLRISFSQSNRVVFEKTEQDTSINGNTLSLRLRQEDTLKLGEGNLIMQIKLKTDGGSILFSDFMYTKVEGALNGEVL